ncbi:hypothetical protein K3495_g10601 [Podosphaera aphanis]|nr:hypothetical protein K3495_g10601 [Podosphaera aphanis]
MDVQGGYAEKKLRALISALITQIILKLKNDDSDTAMIAAGNSLNINIPKT